MTISGNTTRAAYNKALAGDKHSHGVGGEQVMKKGGEGGHNWGGVDSELRDELAAQEDARRDAEEAIADGDERPAGQSFNERATAGTGSSADIAAQADTIQRSVGTEGGVGAGGSGDQEIIRDAGTAKTA